MLLPPCQGLKKQGGQPKTLKTVCDHRYAPDNAAVRGQDALGEGGAIVRAERACRVDLVAQAGEQHLAFAFELDLLPTSLSR